MMGTGIMGGSGFGLIGMIFNLILTAGVVIGIVLLVVWLVRRSDVSGNPTFNSGTGEPSPKEILQTRYARGEITREQYEIMKQDLA